MDLVNIFYIISGALFPALDAAEVISMMHVCKAFWREIIANHKCAVLKKSMIRIIAEISEAQAIYFVALGCDNKLLLKVGRNDLYDALKIDLMNNGISSTYGEYNLMKNEIIDFAAKNKREKAIYNIKAGNLAAVMKLFKNYEHIPDEFMELALVYNQRIFDYLLYENREFESSSNLVAKIINSGNTEALDILALREIGLEAYFEYACEQENIPMINYLVKIAPVDCENYVFINDDLCAFQYLNIDPITIRHIGDIIYEGANEIMKYVLLKPDPAMLREIILLIIESDNILMVSALNNAAKEWPRSLVEINDDTLNYSTYQKLFECIIDICNVQICSYFPEIICKRSLKYAIKTNNNIIAEWLAEMGVE